MRPFLLFASQRFRLPGRFLRSLALLGVLLAASALPMRPARGDALQTPAVPARPESQSASPLVVIDPGHGGEKPVTVAADGTPEKQLALDIALKLERLLAERHVQVRLTRSEDEHIDLKDRIALANDLNAAAFMSIHLNAMPTRTARLRTRGVETYFLAKRATGERAQAVANAENAEDAQAAEPQDDLAFILADLAEAEAHRDASQFAYTVHEQMALRLPTRDRGVHQAPFLVLKGAQMPAILVEVGYLSHPKESLLLEDGAYQDKIAQALSLGIAEFLEKRGLLAPLPKAPKAPKAPAKPPPRKPAQTKSRAAGKR